MCSVMFITYLIRKNFQGVLYAMFEYFSICSNLYQPVVLTHLLLLLH